MKWPFGNGLTLLKLDSAWTDPLPLVTRIECPCCGKTYEMSGLIPSSCSEATVICSACGELMDVVPDRRGNLIAHHRREAR